MATTKRNRRAGIEDRWTKTVRHPDGRTESVPSANHGKGSRWRARYVDDDGNEREKLFGKKADAQRWLDTDVTTKFATGTYVAPAAGRATVPAAAVAVDVRLLARLRHEATAAQLGRRPRG